MAEKEVKQTNKERLKEITDSIEVGIKEMFGSDKYADYLKTMSRFHKYSVNNTILISMQNPNATLVAGFNKWKNGFSRNVIKGQKAIKIIAPTPYIIKEQREKLDPQTKAPLLDADGKIQLEEIENQIPMFRVVSVFDVSQTEGKELPTLANDLVGDVEKFDIFMETLKRTAPVPIKLEQMPSNTDGFFHITDQRIAIRDNMSEVQTISATIHEIAHSLLHNKELQNADDVVAKDRNTEEVEAESISFAVCNYYGIETAENSLGYIANWSNDKELKELKSSLETINKTSSALITGIDEHFAEIIKERESEIVNNIEVSEEMGIALDITTFIGAEHNEKDDNINEILTNLQLGRTKEMREFLTEFGDSLEGGTQEAFDLIVRIDEYIDKTYPTELAYEVDGQFFSIHSIEDGFDYTFYDSEYKLIDGGVYDDPYATIYEVINEVLEIENGFALWDKDGVESIDFKQFNEKIEQSNEQQTSKYSHHTQGEQLSDNSDEIKVDGHIGTWYVTDTETINDVKYFLLEHEEYGDETSNIIVDVDAKLVLDEVWNGFDDLTEHLEEIQENNIEYVMPDNSISIIERNEFGYIDNEVLPLSKEKAIELFENDLAVYALNPDNTETMVFDVSEIEQHNGIFGVEKADWENHISADKEPLQIVGSFEIYQLKDGDETRGLRFAGTKELEQFGLVIDNVNYNLIYEGQLQNVSSERHALNSLYSDFNDDKPDDFTGHSLSVSDIIALNMNDNVSYHYVDSFGFKELPNFLETAEKSIEQNMNMIDGIINNEPKKSVLEELKATKPQEKSKSAPKKSVDKEER